MQHLALIVLPKWTWNVEVLRSACVLQQFLLSERITPSEGDSELELLDELLDACSSFDLSPSDSGGFHSLFRACLSYKCSTTPNFFASALQKAPSLQAIKDCCLLFTNAASTKTVAAWVSSLGSLKFWFRLSSNCGAIQCAGTT